VRAILLSLALLAGATNCPAEPAPKPSTKCQEDDPCWNCHTMGNKKCGPPSSNRKL
jgi:hypothetical protein